MDKSQKHHHGLHQENQFEDSSQPHPASHIEQEIGNRDADLDALEAKLFAMAKAR